MALEDIVSVNITAESVTPSRPGFGTALVAVSIVPVAFTNRVRIYGSPDEMVTAGFVIGGPAHKAATKYFSQKPRPPKIKIGRKANKTVKTIQLKCLSAIGGDVYHIEANGGNVDYTVPLTGSPTTTTVATAINAILTTAVGVDSTSSADIITAVKAAADPAGSLFSLANWTSNFLVTDTTADPGIVADLTAINNEDPDWYGLTLDSESEAEAKAAAGWIETQKKIFPFASADGGIIDATVTTDVASDIKLLGYARSGVIYNGNDTLSYAGAAWMGNRFVANPGSDTWAYKQLTGIIPDVLMTAQRSAALAKNANVYSKVAGVSITEKGTVADGEYFDIIRGLDWLESEIKVRVFSALANSPKIPYTDKGVDSVVSIIKGVLADGIRAGLLSDNPYPIVTAPKVADVNPADKAARILRNVAFSATLAGAIHIVEITGTVSV